MSLPDEIGLDWVFNFGKYRGKTVEDVIKLAPSYIEWCIDNVNYINESGQFVYFVLDDEAEEFFDTLHYSDDYYENSWREGHPSEFGDR